MSNPSNNRLWWFIALALLFVVLGLATALWLVARSTPVSAQEERTVSLPFVAHGLSSEAPASVTTLIDHDTTFVSVALIPGTCRVIVVYVDRERGNLVHVTEHVGGQLVEVPMPQGVTLAGDAPDFVAPGLKHASGAAIAVCDRLRVYMNARVEENGPFILQVIDMPIHAPPIQGE
jgi:hypothetical protein